MDETENNSPAGADHAIHLDGMYQNWFLDYASYVILERAVPNLFDGLKPVQRRILHAMHVMEDGRFHKVANVIGQTMAYHPHGDAAIGDALVNLGQKDIMLDTQGNWGDVRTGDAAAAARYIETRLSKFALEVAFHDENTQWQLSYDGRKKEPVILPVKFPLLLAQGVEGIAVGLSTKILPHNFLELIKGSISLLQGKKTRLLPDFPTGGVMDATDYNAGKRGGKIKVRAVIEVIDKKTLVIREIPFGTTTSSLIDTILRANEKGKIRIKSVYDNTAKDVEIMIELPPGVSPDQTMDALFAFTDCEVSISPNACVIIDDKPRFMSVDEILAMSTEHTKTLLKRELEIRQGNLNEKWHFASLEKIFIEKRIYRRIEEEESWEGVLKTIDEGLKPYKKIFKRLITAEDIVRLTEIKIKRISKFDSFKADEEIKRLENELKDVQHNLDHLNDYAIGYFQRLAEKYGKGRERKTLVKNLETIAAKEVVLANKKLYVNRSEGFIGTGLKQDEFVCNCSDLDDIVAINKEGKMMVFRAEDKKFVGKDILYVNVWKKNDERRIYHLIYFDGKSKRNYVKRFAITGVTRDKEYDLTNGAAASKIVYLSVHDNGESEIVELQLHPACRAKIKEFEFNFAELALKNRSALGNIITEYPIKKVTQKEVGESTIGGVEIYLDETVGRLNKDNRGRLLGCFNTQDRILVIYKNGSYEIFNFELTNHFNMDEISLIEKLNPEGVISCVYYDGDSKNEYVKRFRLEAVSEGKRYQFITEHDKSKMLLVSTKPKPSIKFQVVKGKSKEKVPMELELSGHVDIKGWRALGNRLSQFPLIGTVKEQQASTSFEVGSEVELDPKSDSKKGKKKDDQGSLF